MAARLVDLQRELRRSDDEIRASGRRLRRGQQRQRFVADVERFSRQIEPLDELPPRGLKVAAERIRIRAPLKLARRRWPPPPRRRPSRSWSARCSCRRSTRKSSPAGSRRCRRRPDGCASSPRIGSVDASRCSIFFSIGIDHGSISYVDAHVATCGSMSLSTTRCVEAMLLAAATSTARRAVLLSDSSEVSLFAANPHPSPTSTRTPMARSMVDDNVSTSPLRTRTCCSCVAVQRISA